MGFDIVPWKQIGAAGKSLSANDAITLHHIFATPGVELLIS